MPRLNALYERYKDKGLVIVGVSDEAESKLATYVEDKEPQYPIIRAPGAMQKYGGRFYPSFFTVSSGGKILSNPDDRIPGDKLIEKALRSVVLFTDMPRDTRWNALRSAYMKRRFKAVDDFLQRAAQDDGLDEAARRFVAVQREKFDGRIERTLQAIAELEAGPDYLDSEQQLTRIAKDWNGLEVGRKAAASRAALKKDPKVKKEVRALTLLAKLCKRYDASRIVQRRKLIKALQSFGRKHAGTYAATKAQKRINSLSGRR